MPLLEVDETILSKNLTFQDKDFEDEPLANILFPEAESPELPSQVVVPIAGFCLKTIANGTRERKAFINVCHTDIIPSPDDISEDELKKIWTSDQHATYRVPMSIAAPREELDKQGRACDVYDVAISTMFFNKVVKSVYFRTFLLQVIFEGLANKHGAQLSISSGIILKNRKAMGTILPHRIQIRNSDPQRKLIETVGSTKIPEYILQLVERDLIGKFHVPDINAKNIRLQLGEDRMRVEAPPKYLVDMFIPFFVDPGKVEAVFNCQTDVLTVTVPVSSSSV